MKNISKQMNPQAGLPSKQRSYAEVVEYLDAHWHTNTNDKNLNCMKQLDKAFGNVSQKVSAIIVAGTKGKSLTINFASQLLQAEGLSVGAFYSPHMLTYNERIAINKEFIPNKNFTDIANDIINTIEQLNLQANSFEILTMMALIYFNDKKVEVALLELHDGSKHNATTICSPKIAAFTRINTDDATQVSTALAEMIGIVKAGTHVVSADQSKLSLQSMLTMVEEKGGVWGMPIRKLAQLGYPFEQLHGRCAALAERIAQIYINNILAKDSTLLSNSLLAKQKGQRGRPTLEAKRELELNPKKTVEQFWKETVNQLPGRFQLLEKDKPTILLDNANNLDSFENLLLGIRLLSYQRPLKGLALVIANNNPQLNTAEFLKALRYFFKKTSGQVIICATETLEGEVGSHTSWDVEHMVNEIKAMKVKVRSAKNIKEAVDLATKSVDERNGLVVVTGSSAAVAHYWKCKDIKKI